VLASLAGSYSGRGDVTKAHVLLDAALAMLDASSVSFDDAVRAGVELAYGRVDLSAGDHLDAIAHLDRALGLAEVIGAKPGAFAAHGVLAECHKAIGDFERAVVHLERKFEVNQQMFNEGTDIRIKTLQIAHEAEESRQQAEILRLRTSELEGLVEGRTTELEQFQLEALERLAILGEFRDTDTGEHTARVGDMCAEIAGLLGQEPEWTERLRLAARLHDIGKVAIPDSILLKPGPLTPAEFEVMKTHTTVGARILSGSNSPLVRLAEEVALNHHERWDGTGYPNAIGGTDVPLSGRICAVADVFDALTSERVYKKAWTVPDAVRYIARAAGTQFDPRVVEAFVRIAEERFDVRI
jgi:putative two-component system response regulator